jgi:opacity protein-like surface antigen
MKKVLGLLALLALSTLPAMAQSAGYPKIEVGGGFMYRNYNNQNTPRLNELGWFANADYNFANWLGLDLNVDEGFYGGDPVNSFEYHHFTFMAGPQIYPLGHRRLTPFGHVLIGDSLFIYPGTAAFTDNGQNYSENRLAFEVGGGVDWSLMHHIAIRLGEFDYEQDRNFGAGGPGDPTQNNFKYEGGVIVRF